MMNKNEKGNAGNIALNNLERGLNNKINSNGESISMNNNTPTRNKFQLDLFVTERPEKVFPTIKCHNCKNERELDGYLFKLVEVCRECRTESEVQITGKRFERRRANR